MIGAWANNEIVTGKVLCGVGGGRPTDLLTAGYTLKKDMRRGIIVHE